ncbi:hypothetical protein CAC42_3168 [Sphaceloma murrayae]|uniref:Uncharacterized protein n=1 Tax=Sphaceloma murrayae TaxID=2082308 RepID=A0A2K1QSC9_9PEZI|nr:hypothetical protein CAC42_3168 [Sphaceloma murrayae]
MSQQNLNEKPSLDPISKPSSTHEDHLAGPFDTPKSLSRATTRDHSRSPPQLSAIARPPPALRVDTSATAPDLEKGLLSLPPSATRDGHTPLWSPSREYSIDGRPKECQMWPSRQTLKSKARMEKCHRRRNNCFGLSKRWGEMDKKKRLIVKILIALLVIGIAVGLAIGISRAVGGGVWTGQNKTKQIPGSH